MRNHKFTTKECWGEAVSAMESACREELLPRIKTSFAIARVLTEITLETTRVRSSWQEPCGGDESRGPSARTELRSGTSHLRCLLNHTAQTEPMTRLTTKARIVVL